MNSYTKLDAISPETLFFINILLFYDAQDIMH